MKTTLALCLIAAPAFAEGPVMPPADGEGSSLMEEGMKLILRGMMTEMQPTLDDMGRALDQVKPQLQTLGPKLQQLIALIDDISNYEAPVMLPNGDILIRRNAPLLPRTEPQPGPNGEVEL